MVNRVIILGNLGADPEVKHLPGGQTVCSMRVATSRSWVEKGSNERKEETEWFSVEVWGRQADACVEYLKKGRSVFVEGRLKTDKWQKDGQERERVKVVAENVRFVGGGGGGERKGSSATREERAPAEMPARPSGGDLPF